MVEFFDAQAGFYDAQQMLPNRFDVTKSLPYFVEAFVLVLSCDDTHCLAFL